ncbi:MAG: hypothetical protein K8J31_02275, partial [Anaerolineae bacterium]|nr:hypothetical protein [Anaerolineae bacterium]
MKPQDAWNAALNQLEIQLDRANFDTWLRDAVFLSFEPSARPTDPAVFVIGVRNSFARDNLQHRLYRSVRRILGDVYGSPIELRFEIHKCEESPVRDAAEDMPLFQYMARQMPAAPSIPLHEQIITTRQPDLPDSQLNPR